MEDYQLWAVVVVTMQLHTFWCSRRLERLQHRVELLMQAGLLHRARLLLSVVLVELTDQRARVDLVWTSTVVFWVLMLS